MSDAGAATDLLEVGAVRERCANVVRAIEAGGSRCFRVDRSRLPGTAEYVAKVTRSRYPTLDIPCHSRWRHFEAGGVDRKRELDAMLGKASAAERARAYIDLTVVSVLLDAGAGPDWSYLERRSGKRFGRSEGLGIASFRAFMAGAFSSDPKVPLRVDAAGLAALDADLLAELFQASEENPLVGLPGRAALMRRLGQVLASEPPAFGKSQRPGGLFDVLSGAGASAIEAAVLLRALLDGLGPIWTAGQMLDGVALGDSWQHPEAGGSGITRGWVPFHKLSQWLAYSLLEPLQWGGIAVVGDASLTGLPEYRNGGLLLDTGAIALVDESMGRQSWPVGSELVVEFRALTVHLLDALAPLVRDELGRPDLPLSCILEGGTWSAGRQLAQALRGGAPPLRVDSDGTVF